MISPIFCFAKTTITQGFYDDSLLCRSNLKLFLTNTSFGPLHKTYLLHIIIKFVNIHIYPFWQGVNEALYSPPNLDLLCAAADQLPVIEFPRDKLHFVEKIGEGQFGEVNLCEAEGLIEMLGEPLPMCKSTDSGVLVAVKTLRRKADEPAR